MSEGLRSQSGTCRINSFLTQEDLEHDMSRLLVRNSLPFERKGSRNQGGLAGQSKELGFYPEEA